MLKMKIMIDKDSNGGDTVEKVLSTIDFSEWNFHVEDMVRQAVSEAFRNVLAEDPPALEFDYKDGTSMVLQLQCGSSWNDGVIFFNASIADMIDKFIFTTDPSEMDGGLEVRAALAKCLRDCANKLDPNELRSLENHKPRRRTARPSRG